MDISVKIFNGKLVHVFDTKIDRKKEIILTPIIDCQEEAEIEFYTHNKKIATLNFTNLPPAKARVLDLPVTIELLNRNNFQISYQIDPEKRENVNFDLSKINNTGKLIKRSIIGSIVLLGIILLIIFGQFLFSHISNLIPQSNIMNNSNNLENSVLHQANNESIGQEDNAQLTIKSDKSQSENQQLNNNMNQNSAQNNIQSKYTLKSLNELIEQNTPVYFMINKSDLLDGEIVKLNNIADYLSHYQQVNMRISGHTENIGLPDNELKLSRERAEVIKNFFKNKISNIDFQFEVNAYGATQPTIFNASVDQQYLNRRVELLILSAQNK